MIINTNERSIMILGGPDAGKSNYVGALWMRLRKNKGVFRIPYDPENIDYVESIVSHLRKGHYPPRTEPSEGGATFIAPISLESDPKTAIATIAVPDMIGEIWKSASLDREIDPAWLQLLRVSESAMLFVRFGSNENVEMLDWVTSAQMMQFEAAQGNSQQPNPASGDGTAVADQPVSAHEAADIEAAGSNNPIPTQLFLCDLLNILEDNLGQDTAVDHPRVAIMIAAWDGVGPPERAAGPEMFIKNDYPMLYGRIADRSRLQLRVFGVSATGYDLDIPAQREEYLRVGPAEAGFAETGTEGKIIKGDLLMPLVWALHRENG